MISAILYREGARFTGFRASGHSGYAEAGSDIVCAGVSILSCTCVNSLESLAGIRPNVRENTDGLLDFTLPQADDEADQKAQLLMGALCQGLTDLQEEYPRFVKLEIKERRKTP